MNNIQKLCSLSPISKDMLDSFHASNFLDALYRPGDIVSITFAKKKNNSSRKTNDPCILCYRVGSFFFRARKNGPNEVFSNDEVDKFFEEYGDGGMFFIPTLSGLWHQKTINSKFTYRAKNNFISHPYYVLECDDENISKEEQAGVILDLLEHVSVKSVVDSGNKSLHVLIPNPYPAHRELSIKEVAKLRAIIPDIFDKSGLKQASGSRLANVNRNVNGKLVNQTLLYLNNNLNPNRALI